MNKLGNLILPNQIYWENMLTTNNSWQQVVTPVSGHPVIIEGLHQGGQVIKLIANEEYNSWFTFAELKTLLNMAYSVGTTYDFIWSDIITTPIQVMFLKTNGTLGITYSEVYRVIQDIEGFTNAKIPNLYNVEIELITLKPLAITPLIN